ncbi:hypothetical protein L3Y34_016241 [Caenorhabditis briggsae]|uniref:NR LBD domain-containing protein n=1 Tax=Caenorhabditis briggsae TaxID=6238 RepID=A0AAE9J0U2_CAEBR|nr:hypothetical protein L3Y34_016241 [Caenorhabditis briggsae]
MKDPVLNSMQKEAATGESGATPQEICQEKEEDELSRKTKNVKIVVDDEVSSGGKYEPRSTPNNEEQAEFNELVYAYKVHQRMMQLSFSSIEQFLNEHKNGTKTLRKMDPEDVKKLSEVELTGLLYWIEMQKPYGEIPDDDKSILLHRYSVRKLSLDHFYSASKHPEHCSRREFVMNNYTFVPNDRTGFELPEDDDVQIRAKRECFSRTFNRFWKNVIKPFGALKVTDAEIVFLHVMLLWSASNNSHVTAETVKTMTNRREWARTRLSTWYHDHSLENPVERLQKILELLKEIEIVCDMHCEDFVVAKMYEFCDMSKFFYETLCYAPCNADKDHVDPSLFEQFKKYATRDGSKPRPSDDTTPEESAPEGPVNRFAGDIDPTRLVLDQSNLTAVMAPLPDDKGFDLNDLQ